MYIIGVISGLEDAIEDELPAVLIKESADISDVLRHDYAAVSSGDNGALAIWKDVDGFYRANRYLYQQVVVSEACDSLVDVEEWFDENYKQIQ